MKKLMAFFIVGILSLGVASAKEYVVDIIHSQVDFKIKHLSVSNVSGNFGKFSGVVNVENNALVALEGEVDIDSINTSNEARDAHIKDEEYFNVAKYPKATLKLVSIDGSSGIFELTIKGITKQVTLEVEVGGTTKNQRGVEVVGLSLSGKINRKDFDIAKSTANVALGEQVSLSIDIEGSAK